MKHWKTAIITMFLSGSLYAAPIAVVTSFSILGDVTKQIGGERVTVHNLVGADQDAHTYQLTSVAIKTIHRAQLILLNGLGFEGADVRRAVKQSKVPYAEAAAGIDALKASESHSHHHDHGHDHSHGHDHGHHHSHGEYDPHVWTDPVLMQTYARNIADALIKADPQGKAYYQQRLTAYQNELKKLHTEARQSFAAIAPAKRKVLTSHDAFTYMGKRYNIQFIAPQGVSTTAEPSAKQVAAIIRQIKREGIKAVFSENIKDKRTIERIAEETNVRLSGKLYSDALSKGEPADTYLKMYRYNMNALVEAMK